MARFAAASAAYDDYLARRRQGRAESLSAWLAEHTHLGDALDDAILAATLPATSTSTESTPPHAPGQLGGFTLVEQIGLGAHGAVWRARGPSHPRDVAIKLLHASALGDGDLRARFGREARVASRLEHAHLCRVVAFDEAGPQPWLAMEFVEGTTLAARLATRDRPPGDRQAVAAWVTLVEKLARGLHAAHELGLVHRDVKPGNVVVTPSDEPVLIDFGLVREDGSAGQLTLTGDRMGTPNYMSPEQVAGRDVDRRADVWALGAILHECLSGATPFRGVTHEAIARAILDEPAPALDRVNRAVPKGLALIVRTALAKHADDRYATAATLADDLRRWLDGRSPLARRPTVALRLRRWCMQHPLPSALLVSLVLALSAAGWLAGQEAHARALGEAREASLAFQAGRLQASYGRWTPAEASYARAEALGYEPIAVELARIEMWDATFRADQSLAALQRLHQRPDLGRHRAMVTLLLNDTSRHRLGFAHIPSATRAREQIRVIVDDPTLEAAWQEYAKALTAESVATAKDHLTRVLAVDRRHRAGNEMWVPLVLLTEGPRAALAAAQHFAAIYPSDPTAAFMNALLLRILDRGAEAEPYLTTLRDEPAARGFLDRVANLEATIRAVWRGVLDRRLRLYFASIGQRIADKPGTALVLDWLRIARPILAAADEDEGDAHPVPEGMVLFRLPFSVTIGTFQIAADVGLSILSGDFSLPMAKATSIMPLPTVQAISAIGRIAADGPGQAATELEHALDCGDDFAGATHAFAMHLPLLAAAWRGELTVAGADPTPARAAFLRSIDRLLATPERLTSLDYRFLGLCAVQAEYPALARAFASRAIHLAPDDPEAAAGCAEILAFAGMLNAAAEDLARAQQRWPGHRALVRAEAILAEKRAGK